jgi:hypothetical protein
LVTNKSLQRFKYLLVRCIVHCHISFRMLENQYFRDLISFINSGLAGYLPRAGSTIRQCVLDEYAARKEVLAPEMVEALSSIHLSLDGWTSPNSYAIVSVNAHFMIRAEREGHSD